MRVAIDPPAKRSLNPNEQRVYKLLLDGLEPLEIAKRLHMPLQITNFANRKNDPPDTVMGLIVSIREKGWDVPNNTKEENDMARGQKTPVEKVHEVSTLKDEGKTIDQIAEITGVPRATVGNICLKLGKKEEPAPSANGTSSKEITTLNSIAEIPEDVNPAEEISEDGFCCEVTPDTDMDAYMADRRKFLAENPIPEAVQDACIEKRNALLGELEDIQEQIREIEEFLGLRQ